MRAVAAIGLLLAVNPAPAQPDLPPGRGPVPLRRGGELPRAEPPGLPPAADIPLPEPLPPAPADDPLFPPPPWTGGGELPPRPGEPDDFREPPADRGPPLDRPGGPDWPQRRDPDRSDEYSPRYRIWALPAEGVRFQPTTIRQVRQELEVPIPFVFEKSELFGASVRVRHSHTVTRAILPDTGLPFPARLWEVSVGFAYIHKFADGWSAGVLPRIGTVSDKPFQSTRELNVSLVAFVRAPAYLQGDFWNFSLLYFPNSTLPFPIPGVAYEWNPDPTLQVNLGIPLSVRWKFYPDWQFDFSYRPLTQITSRISHDLRPGFQLYGGFDWDSDGYYLAGRPDRRDLFYVQEKRLVAGVRADLTDRLTFDLSGGYAFDRSYGVGRTSVNYRYDRLDARPGGFVSAWLLLRF